MAKKSFDFNSIQKRTITKNMNGMTHNQDTGEKFYKAIEYIPFEKVRTNDKNDYAQSDIEFLATSIEVNGLGSSLLVKDDGNGGYIIIDGERRYRAIKMLREKEMSDTGEIKKFRTIPAQVESSNLNEVDEKLRMHENNILQRPESETRTIAHIEELRQLWEEKAKTSDEKINVNKMIMHYTNMSRRQVARYNKVSDHAIDEIKQLVDSGMITIGKAADICGRTPGEQLMIAELWSKNPRLTVDQVLDALPKHEDEDEHASEQVHGISDEESTEPKQEPDQKEVKNKSKHPDRASRTNALNTSFKKISKSFHKLYEDTKSFKDEFKESSDLDIAELEKLREQMDILIKELRGN